MNPADLKYFKRLWNLWFWAIGSICLPGNGLTLEKKEGLSNSISYKLSLIYILSEEEASMGSHDNL